MVRETQVGRQELEGNRLLDAMKFRRRRWQRPETRDLILSAGNTDRVFIYHCLYTFIQSSTMTTVQKIKVCWALLH